jgi:hypothetical protein
MLQYRFYNLEKDGQAVIARIDLTLDDDATAIACAEQLIVGEEIQVWQGSRLVTSLCSFACISCLGASMPEISPVGPATNLPRGWTGRG